MRVGHRQLSIPESPLNLIVEGLFFVKDSKKGLIAYNEKYNKVDFLGVMDIIHAGVGSNAIYYLYLQGINAMNQKTALFVVINTSKRMDAS